MDADVRKHVEHGTHDSWIWNEYDCKPFCSTCHSIISICSPSIVMHFIVSCKFNICLISFPYGKLVLATILPRDKYHQSSSMWFISILLFVFISLFSNFYHIFLLWIFILITSMLLYLEFFWKVDFLSIIYCFFFISRKFSKRNVEKILNKNESRKQVCKPIIVVSKGK